MRIYAFEVREDERPYFDELAGRCPGDLELSSEPLDVDSLPPFEEGDAISILGLFPYGKDELTRLYEAGVRSISTRTIGYDHIDVDAARELGLHVCNAAYDPHGVADYTVMMILLCLRNYKQALWRTQVNDFSLTGLIGRELKDLTVGVVGTGTIGRTVAQNLSGFGCRLVAYDPYPRTDLPGVKYMELKELYALADVITLHVPLMDSTYHMIDEHALDQMKPGVVLINCARGALADTDALIAGIEDGRIGALGIDCIESEEGVVHRNRLTDIIRNPKMAYLRQFKNVVHTQHMAFYTESAVRSMVECGVVGLLQMASGEECPTQLA